MEKEILQRLDLKNITEQDNEETEEDLDLIEMYTAHNEAS